MVKFLPSFGGGEPLERKDEASGRAAQGSRGGYVYAGQPYTPAGADVDRMVKDGYEKVIWVFRAIDAIADKMSGWPILCMDGTDPEDWKAVKDEPALALLNQYANAQERSAKYFRYRVVSQLLLSKPGVFVEVLVDRLDRPVALNLLPPGLTAPLPDPDTFLAGFRVQTPGMRTPWVDLPVYDPDNLVTRPIGRPGIKSAGVIWIRKPHPTDPYSSVTPLEAAGISIDLDFYARLYNRNFLMNDGRAGQIVAVKGGLSPEDAAELKARFSPGMQGAGRTSVIEADTVQVQDTATSPRDAQYAELRNITKDDLLIDMGTPESVLGNASGRTFDNADAEKENWLDVTVLPLSEVVEAGFDVLTKGGWGDDRRFKHDVSKEPVLRRRLEARIDQARKDQEAGRITVDEFRKIAELELFKVPGTSVLWLQGGKVPVGEDDDTTTAAQGLKAIGAAQPEGPVPGSEGDPGLTGFDAQLDSLLGGAAGGQAAPTALTPTTAGLGDLEMKSLGFDLEAKGFNPQQPRYPTGHPQGGQFMDSGDTALWLAGKPLKGGFSSAGVVNPNVGSTASPASTPGGTGGAMRFLQHPDASVRQAAYLLTFPGQYAHPRVLGAPPAIDLRNAKNVKLVSLRKGDVVRYSGVSAGGKQGPWAVSAAKRAGAGNVALELVNDDGDVITITAGAQQTLSSIARTPHPTAVAQAKRDVAAAARALGTGGATPTAAPATPAPAPAAAAAPAPAAAAAPAAPAVPKVPAALQRTQSIAQLSGDRGTVVATRLAVGQTWVAADGSVAEVEPDPSGVGVALWVWGGPRVGAVGGTSRSGGILMTPAYMRQGAGATKAWSVTPLAAGLPPRAGAAPAAPAAPAPVRVPTPAPAAAAGAPTYNVPNYPATTVYVETTTGKHAFVSNATGAIVAVHDSQGKRASTNATGAQLAAGRGAWAQVPAPMTGPVPPTSPAYRVWAAQGGTPPAPTAPPAPTPAPANVNLPPAPAPAAVVAPTPPAPTPAPSPAPAQVPSGSAVAQTVIGAGVPTQTIGMRWSVDPTFTARGSNPAAPMIDPAGDKFYVKSQPPKVADNEVTAARLYAAAGVVVPEVSRATITAGAFPGQTGSQGIASRIVATTPDMRTRMQRDPAYRDAVLEDFAVHAWLGNWDAVENNNTATDPSGKPITIDVGGSLAYRARGGSRVLEDKVEELRSMRDARAGGAARGTFAQLTPNSTDARFVRGVERVAAISPGQLRTLVDQGMPSFSQAERDKIVEQLGKRRAHLAKEAGVTLPENRPQAPAPAPQPVPAAPVAPTPAATPAPTAPTAPPAGSIPVVSSGFTASRMQPGQVFWAGPNSRFGRVGDTGATLQLDPAGGVTVTLPSGATQNISINSAVIQIQAGDFYVSGGPAPAAPPPAVPAGPVPANVQAAQAKLAGLSPDAILTIPANYPYPVVLGAPVATPLANTKGIKAASLRKGDVIYDRKGDYVTVVSVDRATGNVTAQGAQLQTVVVPPSAGTGEHRTAARTPHPTLTAAARTVAAHQAATPTPTPAAAATPTPAAAPTPTPNVAAAARATNVQLTTPAFNPGNDAGAAARAYGTAQPNGYEPIPGQTYAIASGGVVLTVHSDGSGTLYATVPNGPASTVDLNPSQVDSLLVPGQPFVPIGPRMRTARFSFIVGRYTDPAGGTVDVYPDGTGRLTNGAGTTRTLTETDVQNAVGVPSGAAALPRFRLTGETPHQSTRSNLAAAAGTAAQAAAPGQTAPAGGWGAAGQIVPGATFVDANGNTLVIGPRGGGKVTFAVASGINAAGSSRNMSAASATSQLTNNRGGRWLLQTPGPTAPAYGASAAPVPAPAAPQAPPTPPLPSTPAAAVGKSGIPALRPAPVAGAGQTPPFTPVVGTPAQTLGASYLDAGQVWRGKNGQTISINADGSGLWRAAPGSRAAVQSKTWTPAQVARSVFGANQNGYTAYAGPDIDQPGRRHATLLRKAARGQVLPPKGTPIAGTSTGVYPSSVAAGTATRLPVDQISRGQTVRHLGDDFIVTELIRDPGSTGYTVYGFRPGVDDPNVITQQPDGSWRQGVSLGYHNSLEVIGPVAVPATNVPANATARPFDPALSPAALRTTGINSANGPGFDVDTQLVPSKDLKAGDPIVVTSREAEGLFVVSRVGTDSRGRLAVFGYNANAAALAAANPAGPGAPEERLFLTASKGIDRETRVQVNGAIPSAPVVPRPTPPVVDTIERADISDATSEAKVRQIMAGPRQVNSPGSTPRGPLTKVAGATALGDQQAAHLMELRGYNALPDVVSDADIDQYVADGEIELWRGTTGTSHTLDLAEAYRSGEHFPGGGAGMMFGVGAYTAYGDEAHSRNSGQFSGHPPLRNALDFAAKRFGKGASGVTLRMTLKADARVADFNQLYNDMRSSRDPLVQKFSAMGSEGVGHYAIYLGYDAIKVRNGYQYGGYGSRGTDADDWGAGFLTVLNRSAVRVSEKNYYNDQYASSLPPGPNPPPIKISSASLKQRRGAKHQGTTDLRPTREP